MLIHDDLLVEGKSKAAAGKEFEHDRFQQAVIYLAKRIEQENSWTCPDNLTIHTVHNYPEKQLFELNMDNLGIRYNTVKTPWEEWRHTDAMEGTLGLLETCTTEYVLYADVTDVVWVEDPRTIIEKFLQFNCDILFCSQVSEVAKAYFSMMHIKNQIDFRKMLDGEPRRYINAGGWIGKTENVRDIFKRCSEFLDYNRGGLSTAEYNQLRYECKNISEYVENYPYGIPDDEDIYKWVEPEFYPRMRVDWPQKIFIRGGEYINKWLVREW